MFKLKDYHPSRVLTLVYQPFALGTMVILAYNESKIDTRKRNIFGYCIFTISTFALIAVSINLYFLMDWFTRVCYFVWLEFIWYLLIFVIGGFSYFWERRNWALYRYLCICGFLWGCRCSCSRWNSWRSLIYAP